MNLEKANTQVNGKRLAKRRETINTYLIAQTAMHRNGKCLIAVFGYQSGIANEDLPEVKEDGLVKKTSLVKRIRAVPKPLNHVGFLLEYVKNGLWG